MRCYLPGRLVALVVAVSLAVGCTPRAARQSPPPQPAAVAPSSPALPVAANAALPSPAVPSAAAPAAPSAAELIDRVAAALAALDTPGGMAFTATTTRHVEQAFVANAQPIVNATWDHTIKSEGSRRLAGGQPEARYHRVVSLDVGGPTADPLGLTIDGEARLVAGQAYLSARYERLTRGIPALPGGWTRFYPASTFTLWSDLSNLQLGNDLQARLGSDAAMLLSGWRADQLRSTFTQALAAADRADGSLPGAAATGEVITLQLKPAALLVSLDDVNFSDPASYAIFDTIRGTPVTHRFQLDAAGRLMAWDRSVDATWRNVDVGSKSGFPAGTRAAGVYREQRAIRIAPPGAPVAPVAAPAENELVAIPAVVPGEASAGHPGKAPAEASGGAASGRPAPPFATLADFERELSHVAAGQGLDAFWARLSAARTPLIFGKNLVVFLWRGRAREVGWSGDWNPFVGLASGRVGASDVWLAAGHFPADARIEYQLLVDGQEQLDTLNPLKETGGLGSKSVFAMPDYAWPAYVTAQPSVAQGRLTGNLTIHSAHLGYDVNYRVYTPAGYDGTARLPALYVTDGQDYLQFAHMTTVLDNLIAGGQIRPIIAVFIDPRDTVTGRNQRNEQFFDNAQYGAFIVEELLPAVEQAYAADPSPAARAILGASNGGYHSAYFALHHANAFHLIGIQSPNVDHNPDIVKAYQAAERLPIKVYMDVGALEWLSHSTRQLQAAMQARGYELRYVETNDVHSYANWRAQLGDMLGYFFGK